MKVSHQILFLLLVTLFFLFGCTQKITPPYSTPQFLASTTNFTFSNFDSNFYDGNILFINKNKIDKIPGITGTKLIQSSLTAKCYITFTKGIVTDTNC